MVNKKNKKSVLSTVDSVLLLIKKYWFLVLIGALGIAILFISFSGNAKLANLLIAITKLRNNFREEVKTINTLSDKKTNANNVALNQHSKVLSDIESEKDKKQKQVETEKQNEVNNLKNKSSTELANKLKSTFKL